jgi:hypothetical protein
MHFGSYPLCLLEVALCGHSGCTSDGSRNHQANRMCWWTNRRMSRQWTPQKWIAIGADVHAVVTWIGFSDKAKTNTCDSIVMYQAMALFRPAE